MLATLLWLRIPHWHWGTTRLQRPQDWRELHRSMWWGEKRNINDTKSPKTQSLQIYSTCASFCLASLSGQVCCKQFHLQNYLAEMTWFPTTSSSKQSVNPQLVWFCFTTCCFRGLYRCCHPVVLIVRCGSCHFHSFFKASTPRRSLPTLLVGQKPLPARHLEISLDPRMSVLWEDLRGFMILVHSLRDMFCIFLQTSCRQNFNPTLSTSCSASHIHFEVLAESSWTFRRKEQTHHANGSFVKICSFLSCLLDALGVGSLKQGTFQQLVMLLVCQHPENSRRRLAVLWPRYTHNCREKRSGDTCGVTCALGYYFASWGSQFLCNGTFQGSLDCILLTLPCFGSFGKLKWKKQKTCAHNWTHLIWVYTISTLKSFWCFLCTIPRT
jgi:hypothetical protein